MTISSERPVVVVKLGSNALVDAQGRLDLLFLDAVARQLRELVDDQWWPIIVSSGAVACGMAAMELPVKPDTLPDRQALAAIGQAGLAHRWQVALAGHGLHGAQVLLTGDDFQERRRYLNLAATFRSLASYGVIPVINENDTVSVAELTVGDNDRLSAMVASQLAARHLLLLTDIDGVYDADPRSNPQAQRLRDIAIVDDQLLAQMGGEGLRGRGGMRSKLEAARLAAQAGVCTTIAHSRLPRVIERALHGEEVGTRIAAHVHTAPTPRRRWLALARRPCGTLRLDGGATRAIVEAGHSLLAAGITHVEGSFERGDTVALQGADGQEIARGLSGLSADEIRAVQGLRMEDAAMQLGYALPKAVVHRDNLLLSPPH